MDVLAECRNWPLTIHILSPRAYASTHRQILFGVPIIWLILAKYTVAMLLTVVADEDMTCIAWDSAGEFEFSALYGHAGSFRSALRFSRNSLNQLSIASLVSF